MTLPVNWLAVVAFIVCWLPGLSVAGAVLGGMALSQIENRVNGRAERGTGLAWAAVVISAVSLLVYAFIVIQLIGDDGGGRLQD